jgi:hypothetical protein
MREPKYNKNRLSQYFYGAWKSREDDRIHAFKDDNKRDEVNQIAELFVNDIINGATDIISSLSGEKTRDAFKYLINESQSERDNDITWVVSELLDDYLGIRTIEAQATAENRLYHLIAWCAEGKVSLMTKDYLHRAAECYLYGFDEQFIIMCRSALEAAFLNAVPDNLCKKYFRKKNNEDYTLWQRIEVGSKENLYENQIVKYARYIKNVANDLLHPEKGRKFPITEKRVLDIMMKTIICVCELEK